MNLAGLMKMVGMGESEMETIKAIGQKITDTPAKVESLENEVMNLREEIILLRQEIKSIIKGEAQ